MAERGTPRPPAPRGHRPRADPGDRTTVIVTRPTGPGLGDLPNVGPFDPGSPRDTNTGLNNRLTGSAPAIRELTVHPAEGCVPVQYGGPLRVGGFPIYQRRIGSTYYYVDFALCEGPIESAAFFKWGDKSAGELTILTEVHLGVPGDTTSTLINAFEPTYSIPEGIAHVVCRFPYPNQTTGPYNPFDFTALVEGRVLYNPSTAATEFNGFPVSAAYDALTNSVYGGNIATSKLTGPDWAAAEDGCEFEVDAGPPSVKRWEFAIRVDQQDTLENWVKALLAYAHGHLRYVDGKYGVYLELPRALALDNNLEVITFQDVDPLTENVSSEISFVQKGIDEVPTVYVVDYTEVVTAAGVTSYLPASVQVPDTVTGEWIETRVSMPAIMSGERARRWGTLAFNLAQLDKDITIPAWATALQLIVGDRFRCGSRRLIGATDAPPNVDAIDGYEELVVDDLKFGDNPVIRASLYRDKTYGDVVDPPEPPNPPDPPADPDDDPDCPTDLAAPNSDPAEYGQIEFTPPADDSIISYYRVFDLFSGTPVALTPTIPASTPVGIDGKIHVTYPTAVHVDGLGTHLEVRVDSVSFAGNSGVSCSTVSWDVSPAGASECCTPEAAAYTFADTTISSTAYSWQNYTRIDTVTINMADVTGRTFVSQLRGAADILVLPGNAAGVIAPVRQGWYHVTAGARWNDDDTGIRALAVFYLNGPGIGGRGLHAGFLTVDAGGSGYTTGQAIALTGGTLMTDGLPFVGTIVASGGAITSVTYTGGLGYTAVPTVSVVGGGTGATITAHLPSAWSVDDLNLDCSTVPTGYTYGQLIAEDLRMAVTEADVWSTNGLSVDMFFSEGSGMFVGVQQSSGGTLSLLSPAVGTTGNPAACRVSLFRIADAEGAEDTNIVCDFG